MDYQTLGQILGFAGINTDMIEERLPPQDESYFVTDVNNAVIKNGKIKKLKGTDYLNDISTQLGIADYRTILGIPIYRQFDADKYLMAVTPQRLYYLLNDTTWTNLGTIANGGNDSVLSYANLDDKFVFVLSDSTIVYYWDGATFAALSLTAEDVTALKCRFLLETKTHLVLLRTIEDATEHHQRLWLSNPGVIATFSAKNKLDLDVEGVIEGGKQLGDEIIVYFGGSIHRVFYIDSVTGYGSAPLIDKLGLYAPKTLTGSEDAHFFLSQKGAMRLVYGDIPRSVSDKKFNRLILDEIDPVYYYRAAAQFYPHLNHLYLTYPKSGSTYNDTQLIYDASVGELVSKKTLITENYSAYGAFEKDLSGLTPDERKEYGLSFIPIMGSRDGRVKEQKVNSYQDGANNYETNIIFPPTFLKSRSRNKRCLQIDLLMEKLTNQNITFVVELANEMNENFEYPYTITGNGSSGIRRYELRSDDNGNGVDVFGKDFRMKIKDSNNPYGWNFRGAILRGYYAGTK